MWINLHLYANIILEYILIKLSVFGLVIIAVVVFCSYLFLYITEIEDAFFQFTAKANMVSDFIADKMKVSDNVDKIISDIKYAADIQKIIYKGKTYEFRKDPEGSIGLDRQVLGNDTAVIYYSKARYNRIVKEKKLTYIIQFSLFLFTLLLMHLIYKFTRREVEERDFIEIQNKTIELDKKVSYLETTYELGRAVVTELVLDKLLENIITRISGVYGEVKRISIMLYDPSREILEIRSSRGLNKEIVEKGYIQVEEGISGTVIKNGKALLINSEEKSVESDKLINETEISSSMCVPIKYYNDVIGVISISDRLNGEKFEQEDLALLESVSYYVAIALKNAKLYEELDSKLLILSSLQIMTGLINSDLESNKMFEVVEKMISRIMPEVKDIYILQYDAEKRKLWNESYDFIIEKDSSMFGYILQKGEPVILSADDKKFFTHIEIDFMRNAAAVPFRIKSEFVGLIIVTDKKGISFTDNDLKLLNIICNGLAIAIKNKRLYSELEFSYYMSVRALANAIDASDTYTHGHSLRVTEYALLIGRQMKMDEETLKSLQFSALLHDVGKISIKSEVLSKPGSLTEEEYEMIKKHPQNGATIIAPVEIFKEKIPGVKYHHEKFDGTGYPEGLKGEEIPLLARIIAVADAFDAMTSTRPYRNALTDEIAEKEIIKNSGYQFDPEISKLFIDILKNQKNMINRIKSLGKKL